MNSNVVGNKKNKQVVVGEVVSNKMDKTIVILVKVLKRHPKYNKYIRRSKRIKVHDSSREAVVGSRVLCVNCRPISKEKSFRLLKVYS